MNIFRTLRTAAPTFSVDGSIGFYAPRSWAELTQEQLRYVLWLISTVPEVLMVKTYMFFRFAGIEVRKRDRFGWLCSVRSKWWKPRQFFTINEEQVLSLLGQFDFIDSYEAMNIRLEKVDDHQAVDAMLYSVRFLDYLNAEKFYQLYQQSKDGKYIERLATLLYRDENGDVPENLKLRKEEVLGTLLWFAYVKQQLGNAFPNFFRALPSDNDEVEEFDVVESINTQIRALTDGDVTKEEIIYNIPCWRALTELDRKAKEAKEMERMRTKK